MPTGVASIAWYFSFQRLAPITGYVDSDIAAHIACDARIPGTTYCRYGTPPTPPAELSTRLPSPRPMDNRNISGERSRPKRLPRQVRLYAVSQDPKTGRPGAGVGCGGGLEVLTD